MLALNLAIGLALLALVGLAIYGLFALLGAVHSTYDCDQDLAAEDDAEYR